VKATIADVYNGHFFWIQADTHPFILESVSAHVTVAIFPIDRLRAILPRANLSHLDAQRNEMDILHHSQVRLAHQAMTALVKEKEAAASAAAKLSARVNEIEVAASPTSVPTFTARSLPFMSPRAHVEVSNRPVPHSPRSSLVDSPEKAVVSAQLKSIALSNPHVLPPFFSADVRQPCHRLEHYCPESEMLALAGSFSTDEQDVCSSSLLLLDPVKQDEVSRAESASSSTSRPTSDAGFKRSDRGDRAAKALQLSFNVSIPRIPVDSPALTVSGLAASCRPRTPRAVTPNLQPETRVSSWKLSGDSSTVDTTVRIEVIHPPHNRGACQDESDQDDGSWKVVEVDLRARVAARLSDVTSPLRTISLVPCKPGERSIDASNAVPTVLESTLCHNSQSEEIAKLSLKGGSHRRTTALPKRICGPESGRRHQPELVRKQGFLVVVCTATEPKGAPRGGRRFYMLVGNELREFPDTVALHDLPNQRWFNCYFLQSTTKVTDATDRALYVPDRVRTQSFQVALNPNTSMVFTAPSSMERKQWMAALGEACSFVSDNSGGSPYPRIKQVQSLVEAGPGAAPFSARIRKRTTAPASGNNAAEEDAMPVEYCIS
jgi:hypothetical protein